MTRAGICLATLGALVASAASAQGPAPASFRVISPIFGQLVTFSMPANFVVVAENSTGPNYIREAVLKGETINRWTQMITVTGAKGLVSGPNANPKATPETFAGSIVGGFRSACPESFAAHGFGPTKFGDQDAYVAVASCGSVGTDRHGETALIVAVKGRADLLHAAMGRTHPGGRKIRHRRGQMAGPAAPVTADPLLPDRPGRGRALPELRRQGLAALLITQMPRAPRRNRPPWCAIGIPA